MTTGSRSENETIASLSDSNVFASESTPKSRSLSKKTPEDHRGRVNQRQCDNFFSMSQRTEAQEDQDISVHISSSNNTGENQQNPTSSVTNNTELAFEAWDLEKFNHATAQQEWCRDLNADQINALVHFMNAAQVRDFTDIDDALSTAMSVGQRPAFEAACALYESGFGDINKKNVDNRTCLHEMVMHQAAILHSPWNDKQPPIDNALQPVTLEERFQRAITLGADPLYSDFDMDFISALKLATENGCAAQLLHAMGKALPLEDNDLGSHPRIDRERSILSRAVASGEQEMTAVRKLVARKVCGNFVPQYPFSTEGTSLRAKVKADWNGTLSDRQVAALARFMEVEQLTQKHPREVIDALPSALTTGSRPAFEAARAVYASGIGNINARNANGQTCLHELAASQIAKRDSDHPETDKVEFIERLAVMLDLGADPFSTGSDSNLESALHFAKFYPCKQMVPPLSAIKETLLDMVNKRDIGGAGKGKRAIYHASSAQAMNFLCDLGIKMDMHEALETGPAALAAYLKRKPSELDAEDLTPDTTTHRFMSASAEFISTYLDAIRARKLSEGNSQEDIPKAIRSTLDWSLVISDGDDKRLTLFNTASSTEAAELLLKERIDARPGENTSDWQNWCDREWNYVVKNQNKMRPATNLPPMELADILMRHQVSPSDSITSRPEWDQLQAKVTAYREASGLWKQIQRGERDFDSLNEKELAQVAANAYQIVFRFSPEQCKKYCRELGYRLISTETCNSETRIAFLQTAYAGKMSLGESKEFEQQRNTWDALVGVTGYAFRARDKKSLSRDAGLSGERRQYVNTLSDDIHDRAKKKTLMKLRDALA